MNQKKLHPLLTVDNQLCFAVYATSLAYTKVYKPVLEPYGLTYPQYLVMVVLWEEDNVTVKAIGDRLSLDSGTLTPLLKRLESAGFINRERDRSDERKVLVSLTDKGIELSSQSMKIAKSVSCSSGISLEETARLVKKLTALRNNLLETLNEKEE